MVKIGGFAVYTPAVIVGYSVVDSCFWRVALGGSFRAMGLTMATKKTTKRNVRSSVVDRWHSRTPLPNGDRCGGPCAARFEPSSRHGKGLRWQARFVARDGREVGKGFALKEDAQRWLDEQMAGVVRRDYVHADRSGITVAEFAEGPWADWLESKKASTRAGYEARWTTHVKPRWGDVALGDIDFEGVASWVASLSNGRAASVSSEDGLSRSSVSACLGVLSSICRVAVDAKRLSVNPCKNVALPAENSVPEKRVYLSDADVLRLAHAAVDEDGGTDDETLILVLGLVGLRSGEAMGLRVGDVNFARKTAWIHTNAVEAGGVVELTSPKSGAARTVSLPGVVVDRLRDLCKGRSETAFVFQQGGRNARGESRPLRRTNWVKRVFYPAAIASGFVDAEGNSVISPHDLRHTAAAVLVASGAHVHQVQRQLGHSRPSITLDVYSDLFDDDLGAIGAALDERYGKLMGEGDEADNVVPIAR